MKNVIPFTKEIKFNNKISEIISISLEEKYNCTSDTIDGEFIISGEYKSHELSVNRDNFEYKLPFSVDLTEKIIPDTLNFEITDFSYDILNDNILKVNVEFKIDADLDDRKDDLISDVEDFLNDIPEIEEVANNENEMNERIQEKEYKEENDENEEIITNQASKKQEKETDTLENDRLNQEEENTIIDSINQNDEEYITYHIHIIKETETLESISALYNSNSTLLAEYNDLNNFKVGEKLIVVEENE